MRIICNSQNSQLFGYKQAAQLFRTAVRSEEIYRDNHAKVIQGMGANPYNNVTTPEVKSTKENLESAIKGESYECDTMYPDFIKQAKAESNKNAVQTFVYAQKAESEHAQLYTQAKNNLAAWRQVKNPFYVCKVSGQTFSIKMKRLLTVLRNCLKKLVEKTTYESS